MDDESLNTAMQSLAAAVFELAGALRRDGESIARDAGQTQARWQVMWTAAAAPLTVSMIARRLGLTRQSVQRTADAIVGDGLATFEPNPDHQRSPLLILTTAGESVLTAINNQAHDRNLQQANALGKSEITGLRQLLMRYRAAVEE